MQRKTNLTLVIKLLLYKYTFSDSVKTYFKVILYSYLILKKMNEQTVNISTNINNERIKTKYIPSYIFENEVKYLKS